MEDQNQKQPISPQKLAANRNNAKRSTGPRSQKGKQRASHNSYKHGFFGMRLFPTDELAVRDWADYRRIYSAYWLHYAPIGDLEKLYVEKIAVQSLRLARIYGHEQKVFAWREPFESGSVDRIGRYEYNVTRHLEKAIDRLERLQEERKAESSQFEFSGFESEDVTNTEEANEGQCDAVEELRREGPPTARPSSNVPDESPTPPNDVASAKQGRASKDVEAPNNSTQTVVINPQPTDNCASNAGDQTLTKLIEQVMDPTPAAKGEKNLGSDAHYQTGRTHCAPFIETPEDAEFVDSVKSGEDLDLLE